MIHKPRNAEAVDTVFNNLQKKERETEAERLLETPGQRNGHDHWKAISDAVLEKDIMELRSKLHGIAESGNFAESDFNTPFDLTGKTVIPGDLSQWTEEDVDFDDFQEPLPRIHIHNHSRVLTENTHYFYREQNPPTAQNSFPAGEEEPDAEWLALEAALKEGDIIDLRRKLKQIERSVSLHRYSEEEIQNFLEGKMTPEEVRLFRDELSFTPELKADVDLSIGVGQAVGETDIMALRETLSGIIGREHSSSRNLEEIEAFLGDGMDDEARGAFVDEMSENRDLRAQVKLVRELDTALGEKDILGLRDALRKIPGDVYRQEKKSLIPALRKGNKKALYPIVAALFILMLGISSILKMMSDDSRAIYDFYYTVPRAPVVFRAAAGAGDGGLYEGLKQFNQGNYHTAILYLGETEGDPVNPAARFYAGASHQALREFGSAVTEYEMVIRHNDNLFLEQAEWYYALCQVGEGRPELAETSLKAVIRRNGYYHKQASSLLQKINKKKRP